MLFLLLDIGFRFVDAFVPGFLLIGLLYVLLLLLKLILKSFPLLFKLIYFAYRIRLFFEEKYYLMFLNYCNNYYEFLE